MGRSTRVHVATLVVVLAVLVWVSRGQWFFGDEWDFIVYRGLDDPEWSVWRPHNEHWSTIPILWYRATFSVFGLHSYWPYLLGLFATHLVVVHCLWRLMRRAGVGAALATGLALVIGLYGAGSENLLWAFQVGFVGSLACGLVLLLLVDEVGDWRRVAVVAAIAVASLMFSGISVFLVGATGIAAFARWGWRKAAAAVGPAAVAYLLWLQFPGRVGLEGDTSRFRGGLDDLPHYVWRGLSATLGRPFHSEPLGGLLLVALVVAAAVAGRRWWMRAPEVMALAVAAPLMFAVISQGRGAIADPRAPRYLYLAAAMLVPLIGVALQAVVRHRPPLVTAAVLACVALAASGIAQLRDAAAIERARELALKGGILTSVTLAERDNIISDRPDFNFAGDVTLAHLRELADNGHLPSVTPTVADLAYARLALQVSVVREAQRALPATATASLPPGASLASDGNCATIDLHGANAVVSRTAAQAAFSVRPRETGRVVAFVPYEGGNAGGRVVEVESGSAITIRHALDRGLVLQFPGPTRTCGIAWTTP